jgi:hypothetical protein
MPDRSEDLEDDVVGTANAIGELVESVDALARVVLGEERYADAAQQFKDHIALDEYE